MISDEELNQVPTRNAELLHSFVGRTLTRLVHHLEEPPQAQLDPARRRELFAFGGGPVQVVFDDQRQLMISYSEALLSITVELVAPAAFEEWPASVEASDAECSEPKFAALVGRCVTAVQVWQLDIDEDRREFTTPAGRRVFSLKAVSRPREAALCFELDDGATLVFRTGASDLPCNFGVSTDLPDGEVPLRLLHLDNKEQQNLNPPTS